MARHTWLWTLLAAACAQTPAPRPVTRNLELEVLEKAARWKDPSVVVLVNLANQYQATHREEDGRAFFCERAEAVPERAAFRAFCGVFEAQVAGRVPLLKRAAWVERALARLDDAVKKGDGLARALRGTVDAELPDRFGRSQQAREDLEWVLAHAASFPPGVRRGAWTALGKSYERLGRAADAERVWHRVERAIPGRPVLLTDFSVDPREGFRFTPPRIVEVAPQVWVAQGYDFADIAFVSTSNGTVAIDAGTSPRNAAAALAAFQKLKPGPIDTVILTHGHWDHAGGLSAFMGPRTRLVAQAALPAEIAIVNRSAMPFRDFFGDDTPRRLEVHPTHVVREPEALVVGDTRFELVPAHGGETEDALLVALPGRVIFVGDVFMPYFGAPFVHEGSIEGLFDTLDTLERLGPARWIHGHSPLTENFTREAFTALRPALEVVVAETHRALREGRTLDDVLQENLLPDVLERAPDGVFAFLLMRDNLIRRMWSLGTGYWQPDGEGMESLSPHDRGAALQVLAGGPTQVTRGIEQLVKRGDFAMALRMANDALAAQGPSPELSAARQRALDGLRAKYQFNPFKFIVYSDMAGRETKPPPAL